MLSWKDSVMCQERHADYRREAARDRLVEQARAGRANQPHLTERALVGLGQWLNKFASMKQMQIRARAVRVS